MEMQSWHTESTDSVGTLAGGKPGHPSGQSEDDQRAVPKWSRKNLRMIEGN